MPTGVCQIVHGSVPGRLRLRLKALRRNRRLCEVLTLHIARHPGVRDVSIDPRSGSILIHFDPARTHGDLLEALTPAFAASYPASAPAAPAARYMEPREPVAGVPWHAMASAAVLARLNADGIAGLSAAEAGERLKKYGPNRLIERKPGDPLLMLLGQFNSLPVALLLAAAGFSVVTGGLIDAIVTVAVVVANAGVGFGVERGSERTIIETTNPQGHPVPVLRDGVEAVINSDGIVPGDVVILRPNVVVPADARVLAADGLNLNEALLTGESHSVAKSADTVLSPGAAVGERANMVFRGAFVASGSGRAAVVATGADTVAGGLALAGRDIATPHTPLERGLKDLGRQLALLSFGLCGAFFITGYLRGRPLASVLKSAIALAVAAIPEGLPVTSTATLALGLRKLKGKGVVVRRLESVEALGAMQIMCFDKTGTLTRDSMEVMSLCLGDGDETQASALNGHEAQNALRLAEIAILCSEVLIEPGGGGEAPKLSGSPTETALFRAAMEIGVSAARLRDDWPLSRLQYRTEANRFMSSIHESRIGLRKRIAVKGDPIQLLYKCDRVMRADGSMVPLDEATRARLLGINDGMAGRGLRVLGFAFADGEEIAEDALIWTGMAGLKSPVMAGAKELLARLHRAGIRPVMITGDQSATAEAIAREIGLTEERPVRVLDSVALSRLPSEILDAVVQHTDVFARVPPSQKLDIVRALQRSGQTVAMAGDGFNDALALKAADIAIAVGAGNATAARDVADIIVTGDDLNVIGDGIEQGRAILSNIRKSLHFMLATNLSEILIVFAESLSARDELETPLELLWLNLVTDILPGLGLALEPPERDIMTAPPRPREEAILRMPDLRHAVQEAAVIGASVLASHAFGLSRYGPGDRTRTVTFFSMVAAQLSHALTCRQDRFVALGGRALFGNHWLNAALAGSVALQAVPMLWPGLRRALGLAPVERAHLAAAGLSGLTSFGANEALLALRSGRANASGERHDA